jgi:hypothetical protein
MPDFLRPAFWKLKVRLHWRDFARDFELACPFSKKNKFASVNAPLRQIFLLLEFFWGLLFEKGKEGVEAPSFAPYKLNRLKCWVVRTKLSAIE